MKLLIFILFISVSSLFGIANCALRLVIDFVRHGAHSSRENSTFFPGIGWQYFDEVTAVGLRQLYLLGRLRRSQYIELQNLLPIKYDSTKIYIRATDTRRAMTSAQSYLLGLYPYGLSKFNNIQINQEKKLLAPPITLTVSNDIIQFLKDDVVPGGIPTIPYVTIDWSIESLLRVRGCPYFDETYKKYFLSDKFRILRKEKYGKMWETIKSLYPQITEEYLSKSDNSAELTDFIICADVDGKKPEKISQEIMQDLRNYWTDVLKESLSYEENLVKLALYNLAPEILGLIDSMIQDRTKIKYAAYIGHSKTLASILLALRRINQTIDVTSDVFGCNISFEIKGPETSDNKESSYTVFIYDKGELIHNENYETFKASFSRTGELGRSRDDLCRYSQENLQDNEKGIGLRNS